MSPFIKTDHLISSSSEQSLILGIRLFVKYMRLFSHPFFSRISPVKRIESTSLWSARYQFHSPRSIKRLSSLTSVICTIIGEATPIYLTQSPAIYFCFMFLIFICSATSRRCSTILSYPQIHDFCRNP